MSQLKISNLITDLVQQELNSKTKEGKSHTRLAKALQAMINPWNITPPQIQSQSNPTVYNTTKEFTKIITIGDSGTATLLIANVSGGIKVFLQQHDTSIAENMGQMVSGFTKDTTVVPAAETLHTFEYPSYDMQSCILGMKLQFAGPRDKVQGTYTILNCMEQDSVIDPGNLTGHLRSHSSVISDKNIRLSAHASANSYAGKYQGGVGHFMAIVSLQGLQPQSPFLLSGICHASVKITDKYQGEFQITAKQNLMTDAEGDMFVRALNHGNNAKIIQEYHEPLSLLPTPVVSKVVQLYDQEQSQKSFWDLLKDAVYNNAEKLGQVAEDAAYYLPYVGPTLSTGIRMGRNYYKKLKPKQSEANIKDKLDKQLVRYIDDKDKSSNKVLQREIENNLKNQARQQNEIYQLRNRLRILQSQKRLPPSRKNLQPSSDGNIYQKKTQ